MTVADEDTASVWAQERERGFDNALLFAYVYLRHAEQPNAELVRLSPEFRAKNKAQVEAYRHLIDQLEDHREGYFGARSKWDAERKAAQPNEGNQNVER